MSLTEGCIESDPGGRPLTDDEQADMAKTFHQLRERHGRELAAFGWDRKSVFGGLDPLAAKVMDDVPGMIALLRSGGRIVEIRRDRIVVEDRFRWPMAWMKYGGFVAGDSLQQLENMEKKHG
ncbi:MAG: hypothetical protein HQM00_05640 [Magnetococcales bacterium]|nr:hypothetical protein [Magnetococcales bacterium]